MTLWLFSSSTVFAIRNGIGVKHRNKPFMVHITQNDSHCSGVRLSQNYILTAAHCIRSRQSVSVRWYEGQRRKSQTVRYKNIKIISKIYSKEIAIIPITGGTYDNILIHDYRLLRAKDKFLYTIYGFGINLSSNHLGSLRLGKMVYRSQIQYQKEPMLEFMRANNRGNNPCQGDSGGPIFFENQNERSLIGIVSFIRSSKYKIKPHQDPGYICGVADRGYYIPLSLYEKELAPYLP